MPQDLTICIQCVRTCWHRAARGGPGATQRNRVPESLKLPDFKVAPVPLSYVTHHATYSDTNNFAEPLKSSAVTVSLTEPLDLGGLSLSFQSDAVGVYYQWDTSQGAPPRYTGRKEALHLYRGQWGRVCYNGRHGAEHFDSGEWWYEKWVYNVGLFAEFMPSIFLKTEPVKVASYMAHLF